MCHKLNSIISKSLQNSQPKYIIPIMYYSTSQLPRNHNPLLFCQKSATPLMRSATSHQRQLSNEAVTKRQLLFQELRVGAVCIIHMYSVGFRVGLGPGGVHLAAISARSQRYAQLITIRDHAFFGQTFCCNQSRSLHVQTKSFGNSSACHLLALMPATLFPHSGFEHKNGRRVVNISCKSHNRGVVYLVNLITSIPSIVLTLTRDFSFQQKAAKSS